MTNMDIVIRHLYPTAVNGDDYNLRDDGNGPFICYWDATKLGAQPEVATLEAAEADALAAWPDKRAAAAIDAKDRLLFEINFDQENRLRALEGKVVITMAQYLDALIARWKALNP